MTETELYLSDCWSCNDPFFKIGKDKVRVGMIRMGARKRQKMTMDHPLCEQCFDCFLDEIICIIEGN